ncbi:hypothetical protein [uncultured Gulosibacter sp.]|uniref:hypothetical protein n=1 Tax=uncultured Gulosibacter sp. TaxID=1339167 RepID=UPI00288BAD4A|nr:hypothetical protein [uncultured Gulosibacter sp.]
MFKQAFLVVTVAATLSLTGCASGARTDSPQIIHEAKDMSVAVINDLVAQVSVESLVPGQSVQPGELKRTMLPCGREGEYQYPASYAIEVRDMETSMQVVQNLHEYMREEKRWEERKITITNRVESKFFTEKGISVLVTGESVNSRYLVNIMAFSPCVKLPNGFRPSANRL